MVPTLEPSQPQLPQAEDSKEVESLKPITITLLEYLLDSNLATPRKRVKPNLVKNAKPPLGVITCHMCGEKVAVFLTKKKKPYIRCGYCSVMVFYNGRECISRLQKQMQVQESSGSEEES
jgi:DNA-directed RNA polymerase subunit RPC12/RpoP